MILNRKRFNYKPCMFKLDEINCTAIQAYRYVIVWTKIFVERGYTPLDKGKIQNYIQELLPENVPYWNIS